MSNNSLPLCGYKIWFMFDMPDGTQNGGITDNPHGLLWMCERYRENNGRNLVITDETFYIDTNQESA